MTKGVNKVILIGHLGADPEVRHTANNLAIANIRLATSSSIKDKQTGNWTDVAEWHRIVFFDRLAEVVSEYLRKGSQIYVEGRLQTRKWQDQDGKERWSTEIVANDMQMLGKRGEETEVNEPSHTTYPPVSEKPASSPPATPLSGIDDDVPF